MEKDVKRILQWQKNSTFLPYKRGFVHALMTKCGSMASYRDQEENAVFSFDVINSKEDLVVVDLHAIFF